MSSKSVRVLYASAACYGLMVAGASATPILLDDPLLVDHPTLVAVLPPGHDALPKDKHAKESGAEDPFDVNTDLSELFRGMDLGVLPPQYELRGVAVFEIGDRGCRDRGRFGLCGSPLDFPGSSSSEETNAGGPANRFHLRPVLNTDSGSVILIPTPSLPGLIDEPQTTSGQPSEPLPELIPAPEPASLVLLGTGLLSSFVHARKRRLL